MSMSVRHPIMQLMEKMSNEELVEMLRREYLRKLTRYRLTDEFFRKKYQMTYDDFEKENIVANITDLRFIHRCRAFHSGLCKSTQR